MLVSGIFTQSQFVDPVAPPSRPRRPLIDSLVNPVVRALAVGVQLHHQACVPASVGDHDRTFLERKLRSDRLRVADFENAVVQFDRRQQTSVSDGVLFVFAATGRDGRYQIHPSDFRVVHVQCVLKSASRTERELARSQGPCFLCAAQCAAPVLAEGSRPLLDAPSVLVVLSIDIQPYGRRRAYSFPATWLLSVLIALHVVNVAEPDSRGGVFVSVAFCEAVIGPEGSVPSFLLSVSTARMFHPESLLALGRAGSFNRYAPFLEMPMTDHVPDLQRPRELQVGEQLRLEWLVFHFQSCDELLPSRLLQVWHRRVEYVQLDSVLHRVRYPLVGHVVRSSSEGSGTDVSI